MSEFDGIARGWKSFGYAGPVGLIMVYLAAALGERFDWGVFGLSFGALLLCWARTWALVPYNEWASEFEQDQWNRYVEDDWALIAVIAEFSGAEIDQLRSDINAANNEAVRKTLLEKAPNWSDEEIHRFLTYFMDDLSEISAVYFGLDGKIRPFD